MTGEDVAPPPAAEGPAPLGRIAQRLGLGALVCGGIAGLLFILPWVTGVAGWGAVILGVAALVVGIVAIAKRRGRTQAVLGIVFAIVAWPAGILLAAVTTFVMLVIGFGF